MIMASMPLREPPSLHVGFNPCQQWVPPPGTTKGYVILIAGPISYTDKSVNPPWPHRQIDPIDPPLLQCMGACCVLWRGWFQVQWLVPRDAPSAAHARHGGHSTTAMLAASMPRHGAKAEATCTAHGPIKSPHSRDSEPQRGPCSPPTYQQCMSSPGPAWASAHHG